MKIISKLCDSECTRRFHHLSKNWVLIKVAQLQNSPIPVNGDFAKELKYFYTPDFD